MDVAAPISLIEKTEFQSMHYERAPHFRRLKLGMAPPPLRSAAAALGERCVRAKKLQQGLGKWAGEWHFTLRERQALTRMSFPPRRQLK